MNDPLNVNYMYMSISIYTHRVLIACIIAVISMSLEICCGTKQICQDETVPFYFLLHIINSDWYPWGKKKHNVSFMTCCMHKLLAFWMQQDNKMLLILNLTLGSWSLLLVVTWQFFSSRCEMFDLKFMFGGMKAEMAL